MAKVGGVSTKPGGVDSLLIKPVEELGVGISEFSDIPFNDGTDNALTLDEQQVAPVEGEVVSNQEPVIEEVKEISEEKIAVDGLLATQFEDKNQRDKERVLSMQEYLGVTRLLPSEIVNNAPLQAAFIRGEATNYVLNNKLQGRKITADKRTALEAGDPETAFSSTNTEGNIITPTVPLLKDSAINVGAQAILYNPEVLGAGVINPDMEVNPNQYMTIDPDLGMIMSLSTEAFLHQSMLELQPNQVENSASLDDDVYGDDAVQANPNLKLTKSKGNEKLGRDIYMAYQRHKAERAGQPTDSYTQNIGKIQPATFTMLGDIAKEVYTQANPDMIIRDDSEVVDTTTDKGQVYFELTPLGAMNLDKTNNSYKGLFAQPEIRSLNTPTFDGQPQYEATQFVRKVTTKRGDLKDTSVIEEATNNYNTVAFVNDPRRESVANLMAMLALVNTKNPDNQAYSNIFNVGQRKISELEAEKARLINAAERIEDPAKKKAALQVAMDYNPTAILQGEREKFMNIMGAVNRDSNKENYLSYYFQGLTGRMAPQQTLYNPSSHKIVRQITGSGNIFTFTVGQGSVIENDYKEIMSALLFERGDTKGSDLSTPERIKLFNEEVAKSDGRYAQYVSYGKELLAAVEAFDNPKANETFINLKNAKSKEEVLAAKTKIMQDFDTDPLSEGLKAELANPKKSAEAIHRADYFMDLAKYDMALNQSNTGQFSTSITVELDGTTHGPATNAALLGVKSMAARSGLLITQDYTILDEIDMRDAMGIQMKEDVGSLATSLYPLRQIEEYTKILDLAVQDRENFLKKSPMTMGYGQELESLKMHVETTVFNGPQGAEIQLIAKRINLSPDKTIDFLHTMLVNSILKILDPKVIHMGRLMKANALFSNLTNEVLYFENASGFRSYAAGKQMDPALTKQSSYSFEDGPKSEVQFYTSKAEGSAIRGELGPGGFTMGLIQPVAVQSYDGNMVARTGSGSSWKNITNAAKSKGGKPFVQPIFDAFVVDLGSFSQVRKESNKNWADSIRNHSYVEKVLVDWYKEATINFDNSIKENPMRKIDWAAAKKGEGSFRGLAYMFELNKDGVPNLKGAIKRTMASQPKPSDMSVSDYSKAQGKQAGALLKRIQVEIKGRGVDVSSSTITAAQAQIIVKTITKHLELSKRNTAGATIIKKDVSSLMAAVDKEAREARNIDL